MEPYSQQDHDKAVEEGMRGILLGVGIATSAELCFTVTYMTS